MKGLSEDAAKEVLEVVPAIMREIRNVMRRLRPQALTVPQYRALSFVDRNAGSSLLDVANHLGLTPPTTSRLVDGLIAHGMITREQHHGDRRRVRLMVTNSGRENLEVTRREALFFFTQQIQKMSAGEVEATLQAMRALRSIFMIGQDKKEVL